MNGDLAKDERVSHRRPRGRAGEAKTPTANRCREACPGGEATACGRRSAAFPPEQSGSEGVAEIAARWKVRPIAKAIAFHEAVVEPISVPHDVGLDAKSCIDVHRRRYDRPTRGSIAYRTWMNVDTGKKTPPTDHAIHRSVLRHRETPESSPHPRVRPGSRRENSRGTGTRLRMVMGSSVRSSVSRSSEAVASQDPRLRVT